MLNNSTDKHKGKTEQSQAKPRTIDQFLALFEGVKPTGENRWMALCPSHTDKKQSLSIRLTKDTILLKCHAGCQTPDIVKAIGLTMNDLFLNKPGASTHREIVATYPYHSTQGKLLFEVVRFEPKGFAQRRIVAGQYVWNLKGVKRVLYHLPEVITGIANNQTIYIVEGEKDADNLRKLGFVATTNPMGAGKWRDAYTEALRGADVVIMPDNDDPGRAHAEGMAKDLYSVAARVRLLHMPQADISDVSAWIAMGATREMIEKAIAAASSWKPEPTPDIHKFSLTDLGNAERLVARHGDNLHYNYKRNKWLVWTSRVWAWDDGAAIMNMAKETARSIYEEAGNEVNDDKRKELVSHATRSESGQRLSEMVKLAQSESGIPVDISELDNKLWLFNCENGTIDLRTGKLKAHDRSDLITIMVPVDYNPNAQSVLWNRFLDTVTGDRADLAEYLRRAVGYSLTGDTRSQVVFFLWGLGCNGKSTFITAIRKLMAAYAMQINSDLFVTSKNKFADGATREDLALLQGKRFIAVVEMEEGKRLAVAMIKAMTGGEAIRADRKYEHRIEFQPTHKIWLSGNHKPTIPDTTHAIWRRMKLIPFTVTIPEPDESLPAKLEHELAAILAWAVKGCLDWQKEGLKEPSEVTAATKTYRQEQDILVEFLEDRCVLKATATVSKSELRQAYQQWCDETNNLQITQKTFKDRLIERGINEGRGTGGVKIWRGICLLEGKEGQEGQEGQENPQSSYTRGNSKKFVETAVPNVPNVTNTAEDLWAGMPDYPHEPCPACGSNDFWPDFVNKRFVTRSPGRGGKSRYRGT